MGDSTKANANTDHAFNKVGTLWNEELQSSSSEEEGEEGSVDKERESEIIPATTNVTEPARQTGGDKRNRLQPFPIVKPQLTRQRLGTLWKSIGTSKDKLCMIRIANETGKYEYHIVQIDMEETKEQRAKWKGEYHARFWIRNFEDSAAQMVRGCRLYPLI